MDMNTTKEKSPLLKAADFDFQAEAGTMQGATGWSPSSSAMASNQLAKILSSDSKLMTQARANAGAASARRGLLNSSIGVEAGESAAIQSAVPLAQQDAGTYARAEEFSAAAANDFSRESNRYGRESALTKYQGLLARESQDRDQSWRSGESALDRGFQSGERALDRGFQTSERQAGQDFQASERQAGMDFQAGQAGMDRDFRAAQAGLDRQQQATLQANSQEWQAAQTRLNEQFQMDFEKFRLPMNMMSSFTDRMQGYVTQIMSDPNLDPAAKDQAIRNYYSYSQQTMGWMSTFFGTAMPNMAGGANVQPGLAQPAIPVDNSSPNVGIPAPQVAPGGDSIWARAARDVVNDGEYGSRHMAETGRWNGR